MEAAENCIMEILLLSKNYHYQIEENGTTGACSTRGRDTISVRYECLKEREGLEDKDVDGSITPIWIFKK